MRHDARQSPLTIGIALALSALTFAGCGGANKTTQPASTPSARAPAGALALQADTSQLKFDKRALSASAGKVTITMNNPSALPHDVAIEGNGINAKGKVVGKGGTSTVTASLKPGSYTFYCSVDAHRQAGMQGTLTVR